ncbi:MAG: hypothetical protein JW715_11830 [Sedimentisphaerales bacterium]|nr:hypothetical protein [Sedimentisphaerales bacterium]
MRTLLLVIIAAVLLNPALAAERLWQELSDPSLTEVASNFRNPPSEYSMTFYWGWDGPVTEEVITRDLKEYSSNNVRAVTLEAGYRMTAAYLSPEWFKLVKYTVQQARLNDMHVWLVDEGKYPSGFAGGRFSELRPDLTMQTFRVTERFDVGGGETVDRQVKDNTICAVAVNETDGVSKVLEPVNGRLNWTAPEGQWQVQVVEQQFRTSATRSVNNPKIGQKDGTHALCDYLKPEAVAKFIEWTHEEYKKVVGDEFGKTVLGFRGDEPDYGIIPWTNTIIEEFKKRKGYDVRPFLASFTQRRGLTEQQQRVKADYWDVWSSVFSENFFGTQSKWCAQNNLEYLVHLNHEDQMTGLARSEGDFFRCMRQVQMPGVDAIWSQIWPDKVADYPKYASSAAHLFGRPRAFTESFAAYKPSPNLEQAMWILNHQIVRGINMVEVMWIPASSNGRSGMRGWLADERFAGAAMYLNRVCYVLSQGRPAAQIGLYYPSYSLWLGHDEADKNVLAVTQQLLENQRDFDFVDEQTVSSVMKLEGDRFTNLSGQSYRAIIVPPITAISKMSLDRLKKFAQNGGKVIFLGDAPALVVEKTFLDARGPADISWAIRESSGGLTENVLKALPEPDVSLGQVSPAVKYLHRRLSDADVYFFFNESNEKLSCTATLRAAKGQVQIWNPLTGDMEPVPGASAENGVIRLPLEMGTYGTELVVVGDVKRVAAKAVARP